MPPRPQSAEAQHSVTRRLVEAGLGLGMLGATLAAGAAVVSEKLDLDSSAVVAPDQANPSDGLAETFNFVVDAGTVLGGVVLAKRGGRHLRVAFSGGKQAGINTMAHAARRNRTNSLARTLAGGSLLVFGAGAMVGNFVDTAHAVSDSQAQVAGYFDDIIGQPDEPGEDVFVISSSPVPELANNSSVSVAGANGFLAEAASNNITAIPTSWEWHSGQRPGQSEKIQLLTATLPSEITGLPLANEDCSDLSASAAKELGIEKGQTFTMDGLTVRVREVLDDKAGLNLLPVLFNNEDFARCVRNNPEQPFSALLAKGEYQQIVDLLEAQGMSADNLSERAFVIPTSEFIDNTKQTGENSVNPLVLQAAAVASIITGSALVGRSRHRLAEARPQNTMQYANGMDKHALNDIATEVAESEAIRSSLVAIPAVIAFDYWTNTGIPGAELGPSFKTALCVVGLSWAVNRAGTAWAMRRETIDPAKGHIV